MKHKNISSSAMTDVAFLLLFFFLILAVTTKTTPVKIEQAQSQDYQMLEKDYPILYLAKDGTLYYQNKTIDLANLPQADELSIMADANTEFKDIKPIIDALQGQGTNKIHCLVKEADHAR
ncbi:MAG: biopolymer transporter ExbD [Sphaerochaetaceae bacterium]